jgi:hypothetical protein
MGRAVDSELMVGKHELNCGMMGVDSACETTGSNTMAPGCCENEFISIEIDDDYQMAKVEFSLESNFVIAFLYTFLLNHHKEVEHTLAHADHLPPPLEQDYLSLFQTFLL